MKKLNLHFLETSKKDLTIIEEVLHNIGEQIYQYAKGYFNYIVTTTIVGDEVREGSLYIMIPEISYDYKIISLELINVETILITFFTLKTAQEEPQEVNIKNGIDELETKIANILESNLVDNTFKYLVELINLKRERNS